MRELTMEEAGVVEGGIVPVIIIGVVGLDVVAGFGVGLGVGTLAGLWAARSILN